MKKVLSALCSFSLLVTMSTSVFADADNMAPENEMDSNAPSIGSSQFDNLVKLPTFDASDLKRGGSSKQGSIPTPDITLDDEPDYALDSRTRILGEGQTFTATAAIPNQGEFVYANVELQPSQVVQASMVCPKSAALDYDLALFQYNPDGTLGGVMAQSTYRTYFNAHSNGEIKTADESLSYVNNSSSSQMYAVLALASLGGSTTDNFDLFISLDNSGNCAPAEPDGNTTEAYNMTYGTAKNLNLNVSNDQDWYILQPTADKEVSITVSTDDYQVEAYTLNNNKLVLSKPLRGATYSVTTPTYIKVFSDAGSFSAHDYNLTVFVAAIPTQISVYLNGDEGPNSYPDYPEGNNYLRFNKTLSARVALYDDNGNPVIDGTTVTLRWESGSWVPGNPNHTQSTTSTTQNGAAFLSFGKFPPSLGKHWALVMTDPYITHYYDIDGLSITVDGYPDIHYETIVYHFMYSDVEYIY